MTETSGKISIFNEIATIKWGNSKNWTEPLRNTKACWICSNFWRQHTQFNIDGTVTTWLEIKLMSQGICELKNIDCWCLCPQSFLSRRWVKNSEKKGDQETSSLPSKSRVLTYGVEDRFFLRSFFYCSNHKKECCAATHAYQMDHDLQQLQ